MNKQRERQGSLVTYSIPLMERNTLYLCLQLINKFEFNGNWEYILYGKKLFDRHKTNATCKWHECEFSKQMQIIRNGIDYRHCMEIEISE